MKIYVRYPEHDDPTKKVMMLLLGELVKFKSMWALRGLESEIQTEVGNITVNISNEQQPEFNVNGFSDDLTIKITDIINGLSFVLFDNIP